MWRRHAERDAGGLDLPLCAHEPLRHRRFGLEERAGDLGGREAPERPQRQCDLRLDRQRRVAAGEEELEALVIERVARHLVLGRLRDLEQTGLREQGALAADPVDRAVPGRRQEPRSRIRRRPVPWPPLRRDRERLLGGLLRKVEVAQEADQRRKDTPPLVAEDRLQVGSAQTRSTIGRTSTAPVRAAGMRAATAIASSRFSASSRKKPPRTSFASVNGPSVVSVPPFCDLTVVAVSPACSSAPPKMPGLSDTCMYSP